jgi:hypothetical protein
LVDDGAVAGQDELRAAPPYCLLLLPGHRDAPHVHIEVVGAGQHQLVLRAAKGAALLGATVVVARMVELAEVDRALQAIEDGRQATSDTQQPVARPVEPDGVNQCCRAETICFAPAPVFIKFRLQLQLVTVNVTFLLRNYRHFVKIINKISNG